jgi:rubrerythrin
MYPDFIKQAKSENNQQAERSFDLANKVEKVHHRLYEKFLNSLEAGGSLGDKPYFVCQVCGNTVEGEPPEKCPICGAPRSQFKKVD